MSSKYVVDPTGTWHQVQSVTDADTLVLTAPADEDDASNHVTGLAAQVLVGVLSFTSGSIVVTSVISRTGVVTAGDWLQVMPGATSTGNEPEVRVQSINLSGTVITLTAPYAGTTDPAARAIRRNGVLPLAVTLPGGPQSFTEWYSGPGSSLLDTVP